jgi:alkyl hydroperoxide reductase subunit D
MALQSLADVSWPDYARDLKLNLQNVLKQTELTDQQTWGTAVASAIASRCPQLTSAILAEAATKLTPEALSAAQAAAAIMGMNNVYYRSLHLLSNHEYRTLPARLRMNVIANPGVDKADFELWSLAVSAINGCGMCLDSHEAELKKHGVGAPVIQTAMRIASVVNAVSKVIAAEKAALS